MNVRGETEEGSEGADEEEGDGTMEAAEGREEGEAGVRAGVEGGMGSNDGDRGLLRGMGRGEAQRKSQQSLYEKRRRKMYTPADDDESTNDALLHKAQHEGSLASLLLILHGKLDRCAPLLHTKTVIFLPLFDFPIELAQRQLRREAVACCFDGFEV
jgi:hypothetical protein